MGQNENLSPLDVARIYKRFQCNVPTSRQAVYTQGQCPASDTTAPTTFASAATTTVESINNTPAPSSFSVTTESRETRPSAVPSDPEKPDAFDSTSSTKPTVPIASTEFLFTSVEDASQMQQQAEQGPVVKFVPAGKPARCSGFRQCRK
ncbi:uncharacterized protein LOC129600732 [Paramacrobiotus metropolitanus]|uniref:uncharacterized protein LOC129600732 n=1 Tax=Paramacrobiotus metropolitanus TaxID=2943436 RepID=UPI002445C7CD|nr:uncharacterized protein LOC129600732 [Paramacrobiotus metropolitanus]